MNRLRLLGLLCCILPLGLAHASRIKDLSSVEGVRSNQLIGYGLVVGLPGTGEKNNAFTEQTFRTMLNNFGIKVPDNIKPKIKDVAPVAIHADLPPFSKPGQTIDVTVSAIGEAKSLRGGTLLQTFLKGLDGRVYAVAQGSLVVGGLGAEGADGSKVVVNTPTVGRIANGATVEREVPNSFSQGDTITFNLNRPDFTTARRVADVVNDLVGPNTAQALDATSIKVFAPREPAGRLPRHHRKPGSGSGHRVRQDHRQLPYRHHRHRQPGQAAARRHQPRRPDGHHRREPAGLPAQSAGGGRDGHHQQLHHQRAAGAGADVQARHRRDPG